MTQELTLPEIRKVLTGRQIYSRCNDLRFKITRTVFERSIKSINSKKEKTTFIVEVDEKKVLIESVNQNLYTPK